MSYKTLTITTHNSKHYILKGDKVFVFTTSGGLVAVRGYYWQGNKPDFFRQQMNKADARVKWVELVRDGYVKQL